MGVVVVSAVRAGFSDDEKNKFWVDLRDFISTNAKDEGSLLGADMNAQVGRKRDGHELWVWNPQRGREKNLLTLQLCMVSSWRIRFLGRKIDILSPPGSQVAS